jgi:hypothetical protein
MTERATSHDLHTDIPVGMTIRDWRAARAFVRPRIARSRVPIGRRRAPHPAAPASAGASA